MADTSVRLKPVMCDASMEDKEVLVGVVVASHVEITNELAICRNAGGLSGKYYVQGPRRIR